MFSSQRVSIGRFSPLVCILPHINKYLNYFWCIPHVVYLLIVVCLPCITLNACVGFICIIFGWLPSSLHFSCSLSSLVFSSSFKYVNLVLFSFAMSLPHYQLLSNCLCVSSVHLGGMHVVV